jgi:predicted ABC-type sugar transport system permease subunit
MRRNLLPILLSAWAVLQLPRLIALPLISSVLSGTDEKAWLFPAMIDIVVAAGVPFALWFIWRRSSLTGWLYLLGFFLLSIFDHASAITAFKVAGVPSIFKEYGDSGFMAPALQILGDVISVASLYRAKARWGVTSLNTCPHS